MEAWKESLMDSIKSIEEAQRDNLIETNKLNELDDLVVRIQELIED